MRMGIDIGGTFTDFVMFDEASGQLARWKRLSTPEDPAEAVISYFGEAGVPTEETGPGSRPSVVHGSTVATNAVLERKGARTAFITTHGFRDCLTIGRQDRSEIYDLFAERPRPLVEPQMCFEVSERISFDGRVLVPLDEDQVSHLAARLAEAGAESVAVSFLFSFLRPEHERVAADALRRKGLHVSVSSEVLPEFREYERASTTALNAYVGPVIDRYLTRLEETLGGADLRIMQSNGGSIRPETARTQAARSILSGPAGGVVGAIEAAAASGHTRCITFDMGGTSTDVSLSVGEPRVTTEGEIDGLPLRVPVIDVHTVGAGGGSVARIDPGGALRVGPESAGARPGPACYGQGGRDATVTDANLILGRLAADRFLGGKMALDVDAAVEALSGLAETDSLRTSSSEGARREAEELSPARKAALGVIEVANAGMERALRVISVQRGFDPADFTLVSFGGAGGLHACELARGLGVRRVLIPRGASTLSAFGMLAADIVKDYVQTVMRRADEPVDGLRDALERLRRQAETELTAEGIPPDVVSLHPSLDVRYVGQSYELGVPFGADFKERFRAEHERAYGHAVADAPVEVVNVRLRAVGAVRRPRLRRAEPGPADPSAARIGERPLVTGGRLVAAPLFDGERLRPGHRIGGPAVIAYADTTVYLPPNDVLTVDPFQAAVIAIDGSTG